VSPLAGDRVDARHHASVDDNAAARAGADDDAEHHRCACSGAVGRFRQREAVGVIRESNATPEQTHQIVRERTADQPRRIRVLHQTGRARDGSGHPDAHGCACAGLALHIVDERSDRGERAVVIAAWRRGPSPQQLPAIVGDGDRFDLRPAEIDADAHER
jgi:hypothetical protein